MRNDNAVRFKLTFACETWSAMMGGIAGAISQMLLLPFILYKLSTFPSETDFLLLLLI